MIKYGIIHLCNILKLKDPTEFCDHSVKDMSELSSADREETLQSALAENTSERWFIISNTGTLLSTFKKIAEKQGKTWLSLENSLLSALNHYDPKVLS